MASANKSIYSALAANLLIAVTKFIAGTISNSSSMLAEAIHSLVDTANELVLLLGINRSKKAPDSQHPFGYGKELYFWSFIVSILIFGLGGGLSIYQGILHIIHPEELGNPTVSYIVLALSMVFEGASFVVAIREFNKVKGALSWWDAVVNSKDPSTFLVLFEDGAAVAGLFIVLICLFLGHRLNLPVLDGVASLLVGLLLVAVSGILARESRSLLMGEGIAPQTKARIIELTEHHPAVVKVKHILSTYQSPSEVVLMLIVSFHEDLSMKEIDEAIDEIRAKIKKQYTLVRFVMVQPETAQD
ncbi:MAG: cation transporter [Williamsia sp.]|nr:cation transporter [Williamsia sp.]